MKPNIILLYTCDPRFDDLLIEALSETGSTVLTARTEADALRLVAQRGRDLTLALLDFSAGCRGMTLLSAIHGCFEYLPIVVTTENDADHVTALAYANGARVCLPKPDRAAKLVRVITQSIATTQGLVAA